MKFSAVFLVGFTIVLSLTPAKPVAQEIPVSGAGAPDTLTIYTENYPPFNYEEIGEAQGLSVDLLLEMFVRTGIEKERHDIVVAPWSTGFAAVRDNPNTILFSTVRTAARENEFKWVGPIATSRIVLVARQDSDIDVKDGLDFNKYRYGIVQNSSGDEALKEGHVDASNLVYLNSPLSAAHMLARGRVDAWAFERIVSFWVLQKLGYRAQDFKVVHAFEKRQYYFAFNKKTDPALLAKLQTALDEIRRDGTMTSIVDGYIPGGSQSLLE